MYKIMRKKKLGWMVFTFILCLCISVGFFIFNNDVREYFLTGSNINRISASDLYDGKIVYGRIQAIIGGYASYDDGSCYIIPIGDGTYMGLELKDEYEDKAVQIAYDTIDYLNEERDSLSNQRIYTRGIIYSMYEDEEEYFYDWFLEDAEITMDEVRELANPYVYVNIPPREFLDSGDIWGCLVPSGAFLLLAVYVLIYMLAKWDLKVVKKTMGDNGWFEQAVEEDLVSGYSHKNVIIGRTYMAVCTFWKWKLYKSHDLIWAYLYTHTTEHRLYGVIKTGTTVSYAVHYVLRNGTDGGISVNSKEEAYRILEYLEHTQPQTILGYSDQLRNLRDHEFSSFVQLSYEKEMQSRNVTAQPYYDGGQPAQGSSDDDWQSTVETLKFPH